LIDRATTTILQFVLMLAVHGIHNWACSTYVSFSINSSHGSIDPPLRSCAAPGFEIKVVVRLKPGNSIHRRGEATNHGSTGFMNGFHLGGGKAGVEDDVILPNIFF